MREFWSRVIVQFYVWVAVAALSMDVLLFVFAKVQIALSEREWYNYRKKNISVAQKLLS